MTKFLLVFLVVSNLYAADKKNSNLIVPFSPEEGKNGYLGDVRVRYGMRVCDKEVYLAYSASYKVEPTAYRFNGKDYKPSDLELESFGEKRLLNVTEFNTTFYKSETSLGKITIRNVAEHGGVSCLGDTINVKKRISGFNDEEAKKNLSVYNLKGNIVYSTLSNFDIEKSIKAKLKPKKEKDNTVSTSEKKSPVVSKNRTQGNEVIRSRTKSKTTSRTQKQSFPQQSSKVVNKPKKNAAVEMNKINNKVENSVRKSRKQGQQVAKATKKVGEVAAGIAQSGIALGIGAGGNDEDNTSLLTIAFGNWDFPWKTEDSGKFWSGTVTYFSFLLDDYIEPTEGRPIDKGEDKFTEYIMGINFLNNSLGMDYIQPVWGVTYNLISEYDENGYAEDGLGGEVGFDYGVALVLLDGMLATYTYNTAAESSAFNFLFKF